MKLSLLLAVIAFVLLSCVHEDFGPQQNDKRSFAVLDFDRLEATDGFDLTVQMGSTFSVIATGDRRDLDDVSVSKIGSTLKLNYTKTENRQYKTFVVVTMPVIRGMDLTGAVNARTIGFTEVLDRFDVSLSGACVGQFQVSAGEVHILLTGASQGSFSGTGDTIDASVSGASELLAANYAVTHAELIVTGASKASVAVSSTLTVSASGASEVLYHGDPQVDSDTTGDSVVTKSQ